MKKIIEFVSKIEHDTNDDTIYSIDSFENKEEFDDFSVLKKELGNAKW